MAPHALTDLQDTSGYYPSASPYHQSLKTEFTEPALGTKTPFSNLGFGSESPKCVWNLSSDEISEIEKNVRYFLSTRKIYS